MTLAELLVAGMIASSSCCASLQVFSQAALASHTARTQLEASELLELHWLASRRWLMVSRSACHTARTQLEASELLELHWLASRRWLMVSRSACHLDAAGLEQSLAAELPLGSQLQRRLHDEPESMGVWLELDHPSSGLQRRQLFTAAGSGWCDDAAQDSTAATSAASLEAGA